MYRFQLALSSVCMGIVVGVLLFCMWDVLAVLIGFDKVFLSIVVVYVYLIDNFFLPCWGNMSIGFLQ